MLLAHVLLPLVLALLPQPRPEVTAAAVLHDWDDRRAAAWEAGDTDTLRRLYVRGAGRADVRLLRTWSERGRRVEALEMQLRCVAVRRAGPGRLDLLVVDRVVTPGDRPSGWRLVLVRWSGEWRMAQVSPARTTSCTVRSRKE